MGVGGLRGAALGGRRGDASLKQEGLEELEWAVEPARSGAPTLILAGRYVHSRYDPEREAARLAGETARHIERRGVGLLVLVGAGLGQLPAALARRVSVPLLLWDPFPRVSASLGAAAAETPAGVRRVSDPEAFDAALDALARPGLQPHLLVHPGYEEVARFETRWATRALRRRLAGERPLAPERAVVSRRAVDALERLPYRGTIADLAGCLREQTAIVVAAGPTLREACGALARRPGGAVIAALQALPHLAEAGVRVDFAVVPDPLRIEPARLARFGNHVDALLADTSIEPELVDWRPERTFLFHRAARARRPALVRLRSAAGVRAADGLPRRAAAPGATSGAARPLSRPGLSP